MKVFMFALLAFSLNCSASEICASRDQIDAVRMLGELEGENNRSILAFLDLSDLVLDVADNIDRSQNEEFFAHLDRLQSMYLHRIFSSIETGREHGYQVVIYKPRLAKILDHIRDKANSFPASFGSEDYRKLTNEMKNAITVSTNNDGE